MTNRTSTQKIKEELAVHMEHSILSFKVLAKTSDRPDVDVYTIGVPTSVARSSFSIWFYIWIGKLYPIWFRATKFGYDLAQTLNGIQGVELRLDNTYPYVIQVVAHTKVMNDPSPHAIFDIWTQSMPLAIVEVIEEVILRNQGIGQRLAERLRRLF